MQSLRMTQAPDITLYIQPGFQVSGRARCFSGTPFAIKVKHILDYKRLAYAVREVGWLERAELLPKISASNKLPVLAYDGALIEDSTEIAYLLDARHPDPPLIPHDPLLAARCHFLEEWADEVLYWYGVYEQRRINQEDKVADAYFRELPEEMRERARKAVGEGVEKNLHRHGIGRYPQAKVMGDVRRGLDALCVFVEQDGFAAGPRPSLADFALFGQMHRRLAGTNPWFEGEVAARPGLGRWLDRVANCTGADAAR
jgi:glutathione S-transferase